jgi:hypothetical protein
VRTGTQTVDHAGHRPSIVASAASIAATRSSLVVPPSVAQALRTAFACCSAMGPATWSYYYLYTTPSVLEGHPPCRDAWRGRLFGRASASHDSYTRRENLGARQQTRQPSGSCSTPERTEGPQSLNSEPGCIKSESLTGSVRRMHRIAKQHGFIIANVVRQILVTLDESSLPVRVQPGRHCFRLPPNNDGR